MKLIFFILLIVSGSACSRQIFIVRHAEKAAVATNATRMEASDPPLSSAGTERSLALRKVAGMNKVKQVYSTNYKRTIATVQPVADAAGVSVQRYHPAADSMASLVRKVEVGKKGNVLIAGHSNTVDDLVNAFTGRKTVKAHLNESVYDRLFILKKKKGKYVLTEKTYGVPTP